MRRQSHQRYEICEGLNLRVPVVQGALGSCDGPRLAAAISRAGGLGCLTVHNTLPDLLAAQLKQIRNTTVRPVLLAFTAQWERESILDSCIGAGFPFVQMFWWNGPRLAPRVQAAGGKCFWQVGTVQQAEDALGMGADVLVAQGTEAGGQVRSPRPVRPLVTELREAFGPEVPIIAGGGLANRRDVASVLALGGQAALLGTRFLLSEESKASPRHKKLLLHAEAEDLMLDLRMVGDWPCAPRRRVRLHRDEDVSALFAGMGLPRMRFLAPAAELVRALDPGVR